MDLRDGEAAASLVAPATDSTPPAASDCGSRAAGVPPARFGVSSWAELHQRQSESWVSASEQKRARKVELGACPRCFLSRDAHADCCICGVVRPLPVRHALTCFAHASELFKPSSTHQLLLAGLRESELCIWQSERWPTAAAVWAHVIAQCAASGRTPAVLFPAKQALPAAQFMAALSPAARRRGVHIVVLDGTWRNVAGMVAELGLLGAPCVVVTPPAAFPLFGPLRKPPAPGRVSTLEAVALLLDELRLGARLAAGAGGEARRPAGASAAAPPAAGAAPAPVRLIVVQRPPRAAAVAPAGVTMALEDGHAATPPAGDAGGAAAPAFAALHRREDRREALLCAQDAFLSAARLVSPAEEEAASAAGGRGSRKRRLGAPIAAAGDGAVKTASFDAAAAVAADTAAGVAADPAAAAPASDLIAPSPPAAAAAARVKLEISIAAPTHEGSDFWASSLRRSLMAHVDATLHSFSKLRPDMNGVGYRTWYLTAAATVGRVERAGGGGGGGGAAGGAAASAAAGESAAGESAVGESAALPPSAAAAARAAVDEDGAPLPPPPAALDAPPGAGLVVTPLAGPLLSRLPAYLLTRIATAAYGPARVLLDGYLPALIRGCRGWGRGVPGGALEEAAAAAPPAAPSRRGHVQRAGAAADVAPAAASSATAAAMDAYSAAAAAAPVGDCAERACAPESAPSAQPSKRARRDDDERSRGLSFPTLPRDDDERSCGGDGGGSSEGAALAAVAAGGEHGSEAPRPAREERRAKGQGGPRALRRKPLPPASAYTATPLARTCVALYALSAGHFCGSWHRYA